MCKGLLDVLLIPCFVQHLKYKFLNPDSQWMLSVCSSCCNCILAPLLFCLSQLFALFHIRFLVQYQKCLHFKTFYCMKHLCERRFSCCDNNCILNECKLLLLNAFLSFKMIFCPCTDAECPTYIYCGILCLHTKYQMASLCLLLCKCMSQGI